MADSIEQKRPELEYRELELKVRELEIKVGDLQKPSYKKMAFWTSLITVCIAVIGIIGQSYLSNIKNAQAKLETERANEQIQEAQAKKNSLDAEIRKSSDSVLALQIKRDSMQADLDEIIAAYNKIVSQVAYTDSTEDNDPVARQTNQVVTQTNKVVSNLLLNNASDLLLKSSILKVYYLPATRAKAIAIDALLRSKGANSSLGPADYDISRSDNKIIYYNASQINYCKAVQALLKQSGKGDFDIRPSSALSTGARTKHFKVYVTE
jgi:hypothetical protein